MSKTICRVWVDKNAFDPGALPTAAEEVRDLLKAQLFNQLRAVNTVYAKLLLNDEKGQLTQAELALLLLISDIKDWRDLPDHEIMALVEKEEYSQLFGNIEWKYSVREEANCLSGLLKVFVPGFKMTAPRSWENLEEIPGFQFSVDIFDDKDVLVQSIKSGTPSGTQISDNEQNLNPGELRAVQVVKTQSLDPDNQEDTKSLAMTVVRLLSEVGELKESLASVKAENVCLKQNTVELNDRLTKVEVVLANRSSLPNPWDALHQ